MKAGFEETCRRFSKAIEIAALFPDEMRLEILKILVDRIKNDEDAGTASYKEQIMNVTENGHALVDFLVQKNAVSNIERSLLFVYLLNSKGIETVSAKHIEFCYSLCAELCDLPMPGNLLQNLRDACSTRYGYLSSVQNCFFLTEKGKNFCES